MAWYSEQNKTILAEYGLPTKFVWGEIKQIRAYGDIMVVEHDWIGIDSGMTDDEKHSLSYSVYLNEKDANTSGMSWDHALLIALERKYLGRNSQFADFAGRMLNMKEGE